VSLSDPVLDCMLRPWAPPPTSPRHVSGRGILSIPGNLWVVPRVTEMVLHGFQAVSRVSKQLQRAW
jgi:hypothetical protein